MQAHCGLAAGMQVAPEQVCPAQEQSASALQWPGSPSIAGMQSCPRGQLQTQPQMPQSLSLTQAPPGPPSGIAWDRADREIRRTANANNRVATYMREHREPRAGGSLTDNHRRPLIRMLYPVGRER